MSIHCAQLRRRLPRKRRLCSALIAAMASATALPALADEAFWNGSQSGSWFNGLNWSPVGPPGPNDDVVIDTNNPNATNVDGAAAGAILNLTVGRTGNATLQIFNGGSVNNQVGIIGETSGSLGAVTVTQAGSVWNNAQNLYVGLGGTGTLNILNGGQVNSTGASGIGLQEGAEGVVLVAGAGSNWTNSVPSGALSIGGSGTGTLLIANGGTVNNTIGTVGSSASGVGTVEVSGLGSVWTNTGSLSVGGSGQGTLGISNGGQVLSASGTVGNQGSAAVGTVTVEGMGSNWTIGGGAGSLSVGAQGGTGTLHIVDGGAVFSGSGTLGHFSGHGDVLVSGPGSNWIMSDDLLVGRAGSGTLVIENQAAVSSAGAALGDLAGSEGEVTVTGTGSVWNPSGQLLVGNAGNGVLTIADGGEVVNAGVGNGLIGVEAGSTGTVTVTGAGSLWDTGGGALYAGVQGDGTLAIADGASVASGFAGIGDGPGSTGLATLSGGALWTIGANLSVGGGGSGSLSIGDGSTVLGNSFAFISGGGTASIDSGSALNLAGGLRLGGDGALYVSGQSMLDNTNALIGTSGTSEATATVSGAGSHWANSEHLVVGDQGLGALAIADGGMVSNTFAVIGDAADAVGLVSVEGAGSLWASTGMLTVGNEGSGTLSISDGGAASGNAGAVIASALGSTGAARVAGADSTWSLAQNLVVADNGSGELDITGGALVSNANGYLGFEEDADGRVTVSGSGSRWHNGSGLFVGLHGTGMLEVLDGAQVDNLGGAVGSVAGSHGTIAVTGEGSLWTTAAQFAIGGSGHGEVTVADGGRMHSEVAVIGASAGGSGAVTVTGAESAWHSTSSLVIGSNGTGHLAIADGATVSGDSFAWIGSAAGTGTVTVDGTGSRLAMEQFVTVGRQGTGRLVVADGGSVATGTIGIAGQAGSEGTLDIGAGAAEDAVAPGVVDAALVNFGDGDGTLNFNHTADDYDFAPRLGGAGTVNVFAGTTAMEADSSGFGGETFVHGGTLRVDGTLGGTLDVLAGGTLTGSGTVGTTTVAGTLAPGGSVGTLTIDGDVSFLPGSTFEVELDTPGHSDLLTVGGTAILSGGLVAALPLNNIAIDSPYTLLTAGGGVAGSFDALELDSHSVFLSPTLIYEPDAVLLALLQSASFASVGLTPNQIATGTGADSLGSGHPVWNAIVVLDEVQARSAFDALSGEIHASTLGALLDESRYIRNAANGRLYDASLRPAEDRGFWVEAFGSRDRADGDGNADRLDRSAGGLFVGGDVALGEGWRLGAALGYHRSSHDAKARRSSADVDSNHLAVYAGRHWGPSALRLGGAYARHRVDTDRRVEFPGHAEWLHGDYRASTRQLFGEYGYRIDRGDIAWEPFLGLAWVQVDGDSFEETGGTAALSVADSRQDLVHALLGVRLAARFDPAGAGATTLRGMLGWQHASGDTGPRGRFAFDGGEGFTIAGTPVAGNAFVVGAGVDFGLGDSARLGISYAGRFGSDVRENGLRAVFTMTF